MSDTAGRFRNVVETLQDATAVFSPVRDADGRVIDLRYEYLNPAAARIGELAREQTIGRTMLQLFQDRLERSWWTNLLDELSRQGCATRRGARLGRQGRVFDVMARAVDQDVVISWRDVTDRLQVEEALKAERDFSNAVLDVAGALVVVLDRRGIVRRFNRACETLSGRPAAEVIGRRFLDLQLLPANETHGLEDKWALPFGGFPDKYENTWIGADGAPRRIAWSNTVLRNSEGAVEFIISTGIDITQWRRAQQAQQRAADEVQRLNSELRERALDMQTMLDLAPIAIFIAHDPECTLVTGNKAAAAMIGQSGNEDFSLTRNELGEGWPYELMHQGRPVPIDEMPMVQAARGLPVSPREYEFVLDDGTRKVIFGKAAPRLDADGRINGSIAAFTDVTELVHVRNRLAAVFNRDLIGNVTWTVGGRIMTANDAFLDMIGYTREDLEAGRLSLLALTPPEYAAIDAEKAVELMRDGRHGPYEKEYMRKGGGRVPVLVSTARFPDSMQEGISYIVDLTNVKAAEGRIRELLAEVQAASEAKDEFIAMLAHELRNPLAPISNAVQILRAHRSRDPQLLWCRDVIERQVSHMARLLEDLLDVSRISRHKLLLRKERVDLARVIHDAVETSRPVLEAGGHSLQVQLPPRAVVLDGDPVRLAQVFSNLLNNAAKYTPEGGHIEIEAQCQDDCVAIAVRDNGIGIEPDMLTRVFDIFSQAAPARARAQGGLGIGLSLVRGIVQLHEGHVIARSAGPGRGSEFIVTLPVPPETAQDTAMAGLDAAESLHDQRILVVDDNRDSADTLAMLLELAGSQVRTAYTGEQALALGATFAPTALLLDVGMPGLSGLEVCERARQTDWGREALIIAMTGWGQADDRRQTREAGFDHHLVKPVDVGELTRLLTRR